MLLYGNMFTAKDCTVHKTCICRRCNKFKIRPAGRNDVTVTAVGLDFNTPDAIVRDYLNKFGSVIGDTTVYSKF